MKYLIYDGEGEGEVEGEVEGGVGGGGGGREAQDVVLLLGLLIQSLPLPLKTERWKQSSFNTNIANIIKNTLFVLNYSEAVS